MAIIIEAPNEVYSIENQRNIKLFLAGGITNCPDWQKEMVDMLEHVNDLTIYNPRRLNFPMDNPKAAEEQISWEYNHLTNADLISFWFSKGSLNPIVLFELGKFIETDKKIFIGIDPEYERRQDVEIQTLLSNPSVEIVYSVKELSDQIINTILRFMTNFD
jgi:hypothetical protein